MIIITTCEKCKKEIHFDYNKCSNCIRKNILKYQNGKYSFQGQTFTKNSWYRKIGNYLSFDNSMVVLRRIPDEIRISYIKAFVLKNIKKATFLRLILPCAAFLALSLVLLWGGRFFQDNANLLNYNQMVFLTFLGGLFFILGSVLLVKIIIFQEKVIMQGNDKRTKVKHITKKQYHDVIDLFKKADFIYFKEIKNTRISIRELRYSDEFDLFDLFKNENVTKYLAFSHYESLDQAKTLIEKAINQYKNQEIFYLGIVSNDNNKLIGYIGLSRYDLTATTCQVVYALNEKYWKKGIMTDSLMLFIDYLFNEQNKEIIIGTHIDNNESSGKVMLKAGMMRDKFYDQEMVIKGKTEKLLGYSIKRSEI